MTQPPDPHRPPPIRHGPPDPGGPPIGYATPYGCGDAVPTPFGLSPAALFFLGLSAGFGVSIAVWGAAYLATDRHSQSQDPFGWWVIGAGVVLLVKVVASIVLLCQPGRRLLGGGLLTSVALGFLTCGYAGLSAFCGSSFK